MLLSEINLHLCSHKIMAWNKKKVDEKRRKIRRKIKYAIVESFESPVEQKMRDIYKIYYYEKLLLG